MGKRPANFIEKAAKYLLKILQEKGQVDYDYFYDGEEQTLLKIINGIGITKDEADYYVAESLIDCAVYELEEQGIVETEQLESMLVDGEQSYRIILTDEGKAKLRKGVKLEFWPAE